MASSTKHKTHLHKESSSSENRPARKKDRRLSAWTANRFDLYHCSVNSPETDVDFLINYLGYERKSCEALEDLYAHKLEQAAPSTDVGAPTDKVFEAIKVRSKDFPKKLSVEDSTFKLIDMIDLINTKNEKAHSVAIEQARDQYRTRQKLKYPDGVTIEDVGIAYEGGYAEWEITGSGGDLVARGRRSGTEGSAEAAGHLRRV